MCHFPVHICINSKFYAWLLRTLSQISANKQIKYNHTSLITYIHNICHTITSQYYTYTTKYYIPHIITYITSCNNIINKPISQSTTAFQDIVAIYYKKILFIYRSSEILYNTIRIQAGVGLLSRSTDPPLVTKTNAHNIYIYIVLPQAIGRKMKRE